MMVALPDLIMHTVTILHIRLAISVTFTGRTPAVNARPVILVRCPTSVMFTGLMNLTGSVVTLTSPPPFGKKPLKNI